MKGIKTPALLVLCLALIIAVVWPASGEPAQRLAQAILGDHYVDQDRPVRDTTGLVRRRDYPRPARRG
jgi:hypothetical protein